MNSKEWTFDVNAIDHKVAQVNFDFGSNYEEVFTALEAETGWEPYGQYAVTPNHREDWQGYRYKLYNPNNPLLKEIVQYFASEETKRMVVDALYAYKSDMAEKWGMPAEQMYDNVTLHGELTKDMPGFENGIHCDFRRLVATGMIFFTNEDNVDHATHFYSNPQRDNPIQIPSNFGEGWLHANDWDTWHDGWNRTDKVRYSMLLGLTLRLATDS